MKNLSLLFIAFLLIQLTGCKSESERDAIKENNSSQNDNSLRDITIDDIVNVPPDFQIQYEIIKIEDLSYSGVDKRRGNISVPSGLSKKELNQNIYHSIKTIYNKYHSDGISILIYLREKDGQIGNYLGRAEFTPDGGLNKVGHISLEDYHVKLDIQYWYFNSDRKNPKKTKPPLKVVKKSTRVTGYFYKETSNRFYQIIVHDNGQFVYTEEAPVGNITIDVTGRGEFLSNTKFLAKGLDRKTRKRIEFNVTLSDNKAVVKIYGRVRTLEKL